MLTKLFFFLCAFCFPLEAVVLKAPAFKITEMHLEQAVTNEQLERGLMLRDKLNEDSGMVFNYSYSQYISFWMFNCLIDLSAAFIDKHHVIRQISELKAYPEQMHAFLPLGRLHLKERHPAYDFFYQRRVTARMPVKYAIEMNKGWFEKKGVRVGDVALWKGNKGAVLHTLDVGEYTKNNEVVLEWDQAGPKAVRTSVGEMRYAFLDGQGKVVQQGYLSGDKVAWTARAKSVKLYLQK